MIELMQRALSLASRAAGRTAPNPMVGALVVKDGEVVGEGYHVALGEPHAETMALAAAGSKARGSTVVVTLEPCCHYGRTPPCTQQLIAAGVERVIVAMKDPDPRVSGSGIQELEKAGIDVVVGVGGDQAAELIRGYVLAKTQSRPAITLKVAASLDGRIADQHGHSQWITAEATRRLGHQLRNTHDAILVGSGTVTADDPHLTTRSVEGGRDPVAVVLDTQLALSSEANLLAADRPVRLYCSTEADSREFGPHVTVAPVGAGPDGVHLSEVLSDMVEAGIHTVLVEGGGRVHRSFLDAAFVDRIELFLAPRLLGQGPGWVGGTGFALAEAPHFEVSSVERLASGDLHICLLPAS